MEYRRLRMKRRETDDTIQFVMDNLNIYTLCTFDNFGLWHTTHTQTIPYLYSKPFRRIRKHQHAQSHFCFCFKEASNQPTKYNQNALMDFN